MEKDSTRKQLYQAALVVSTKFDVIQARAKDGFFCGQLFLLSSHEQAFQAMITALTQEDLQPLLEQSINSSLDETDPIDPQPIIENSLFTLQVILERSSCELNAKAVSDTGILLQAIIKTCSPLSRPSKKPEA